MTDSSAKPTPADAATRFVDRLDRLATRADRARLAALRKLVAPEDRWGPDVYATAYQLLPSKLYPDDERRFLLVAGLYALWHRGAVVPAVRSGKNFGASMRLLVSRGEPGTNVAQAVEHRFAVVLGSEDERLAHHLRQAVVQLSSAGTNIDFAVLLADLRRWDHPDRFVQRRWAHEFWTESLLADDGKAPA